MQYSVTRVDRAREPPRKVVQMETPTDDATAIIAVHAADGKVVVAKVRIERDPGDGSPVVSLDVNGERAFTMAVS